MAHFREFQDNYPFLVNYMHNGFIENSTLFYSTTPEMMETDLQNQNIKVLHHIATDGPIFIYRDIVENMDKSDFEAFMDIHLTHCDKKSNLGYSEHGLIVAQKETC